MTGALVERLRQRRPGGLIPTTGRVVRVAGLQIHAAVPGARVGDLVEMHTARRRLRAEVIGFDDHGAVVMPLGPTDGIGADTTVECRGERLGVACSEAMLGRILDGLGRPLDDGPDLRGELVPIERRPPDPLQRPRIREPLITGIRAIDGLMTLGRGQRIGLFAGPGMGKSTLLGQLTRQAEADVAVCALVGERGRELREFIEDSLGAEGRERSVVVCATSDAPSLVRHRSALVATTIAEWFRDRGANVLLVMDSLTRFARAQREIGLARGEPPTRRGYPPSVAASLPRLLERAGTSPRGTITAVYTVLTESDDADDPIGDEVRGLLDGHIRLSAELSEREHWPAIDVTRSLSRVMAAVISSEHRAQAAEARGLLSAYERSRDLIELGAYERGSDPRTDRALATIASLESFLQQSTGAAHDLESTLSQLREACR